MSTPIAMMASNGAVDVASVLGAELVSCVRSLTEPSRSAAAPPTPPADDDSIWDAE
jgi:hypothetical protein